MNFLTVKKVAKLIRRGEPGRHFDGAGLYLIIKSGKRAAWERRYELDHKAHAIGLGSALKAFSLGEARERNRKISQQLADGVDPLAAKRQARAAAAAAAAKAMSFRQCADAYIAAHQAKWRSTEHGRQWLTTLATYVHPILGSLSVSDVDTPAVLRVLEQRVPAQRGLPGGQFWQVRAVTADRVRNRIELVLSWAAGRGYRGKEANPARWADLKHILPPPTKVVRVNHHAAVPYAELPALMAELRQREGIAVRALIFTILTAARVGEVLSARWDEVNFTDATWVIPAARMKGGKEHRVPLSPQALELLHSLHVEDGNPHLFIGPRRETLSRAVLAAALRGAGRPETVHGFRSSFSDWSHERTSHANHTIETCLAHVTGGAVERAYRRGDLFDKRKKLMEAWGAFCASPPKAAAGNVTALRGARP
jgi:integrase